MPTPNLTHKQLRFVDEYMVDGNGAAAAVRAGYSARTARTIASAMLTKFDIRRALELRQAQLSAELKVTRSDVVRGLLEAFEMARSDRNPGAMISAMTALAKMLGFYEPETKRVELGGDGARLRMKFEALSDEELLLIASGQQLATH